MLTEKQKEFCKNVVSGLSYKDSYISAYGSTGNVNTAYVESSRLIAREDIQKELERLRKPQEIALAATAISETEKIKRILWEEIENARTQQDHAAIARYTDQLNKLNNAYKDSSNLETKENDISDLDTTKLLKLVGNG